MLLSLEVMTTTWSQNSFSRWWHAGALRRLGFPVVATRVSHCGSVVAEEQVDAGALGLVSLEQVGKVGAAGGEDMAACPQGDSALTPIIRHR